MTHNSVEKLFIPGSKVLYFFFGGINAGIAMPPFEFYKASGIINENKVFMRDLSQSWYHAGLQGISKDIDTTALYIKNIIKEINPDKTYFVGNSMGGYAAIIFCTLIGKGEVIAFGPQTFISSDLREKYKDTRNHQKKLKALNLATTNKKVHDLRQMLLRSQSNCKISIFVARDSTLDLNHARHIKECPGVCVFEFDTGGHSLVRKLRNEGKLAQIMVGKYV